MLEQKNKDEAEGTNLHFPLCKEENVNFSFCKYRICIDLKTGSRMLCYFETIEVVDEVNHCATNRTHHRDRMTQARN